MYILRKGRYCSIEPVSSVAASSEPRKMAEFWQWLFSISSTSNASELMLTSPAIGVACFVKFKKKATTVKFHDAILTDQWRVIVKITTQYDTEPKIDFK